MSWRFPLFVARRYLRPTRRHRFLSFITAVSVVGVMLGSCAVLVSLSILQGFDRSLRATVVDFMGHIEIKHLHGDTLTGYPAALRKILDDRDVTAASPFAQREGIIRSSDGMEGVLLKGVQQDRDVSKVRGRIVQGSFDLTTAEGATPKIVIGERLANKLLASVGDTIVFFAVQGIPGPDNPPRIEQFVVTGLYRSGMAQYDDIYTYTSLTSAQRLFGFGPTSVSGFDVVTRDIQQIDITALRLGVTLRDPYLPQTFQEKFMPIFAWLDLQRQPIPIVLGLIVLVATFNVVSTLLMTVLEKTESIGVLGTLGASPRTIMSIFVSKGALISTVGLLLGALISFGFEILQQKYKLISLDATIYVFDAVPVSIDPLHYAAVIIGVLVVSMLATLIPAWIAARLSPVAALRLK